MKIVIIDYGAGNTQSVMFALQRLGITPVLSNEQVEIEQADKVIFPGVGHAAQAMNALREANLVTTIQNLRQPVFGICLGMQLMCQSTEEGNEKGLGIFDAEVKKFVGRQKIPHMGWNEIQFSQSNPLFRNVEMNTNTYFVHSFYAEITDETIATTNYILPFSACMQKANFIGCQFHPEKSGLAGQQILENFIKI